jgi:hypothetical protein
VANFDKAGKPLLSWRVHLLPFLDQVKLYKEFHLDEPWDSEHNKGLIDKMPAVYRSTEKKEMIQAGKTTFLAPVGEDFMFTGTPKTLTFRDITDGTSNTILLVDADDNHAVVWTQPEDFKPYPKGAKLQDLLKDFADPKKAEIGLRKRPASGFLTLFADGSVHVLPSKIDPSTLYFMFTRNGGEVINWP